MIRDADWTGNGIGVMMSMIASRKQPPARGGRVGGGGRGGRRNRGRGGKRQGLGRKEGKEGKEERKKENIGQGRISKEEFGD